MGQRVNSGCRLSLAGTLPLLLLVPAGRSLFHAVQVRAFLSRNEVINARIKTTCRQRTSPDASPKSASCPGGWLSGTDFRGVKHIVRELALEDMIMLVAAHQINFVRGGGQSDLLSLRRRRLRGRPAGPDSSQTAKRTRQGFS